MSIIGRNFYIFGISKRAEWEELKVVNMQQRNSKVVEMIFFLFFVMCKTNKVCLHLRYSLTQKMAHLCILGFRQFDFKKNGFGGVSIFCDQNTIFIFEFQFSALNVCLLLLATIQHLNNCCIHVGIPLPKLKSLDLMLHIGCLKTWKM